MIWVANILIAFLMDFLFTKKKEKKNFGKISSETRRFACKNANLHSN